MQQNEARSFTFLSLKMDTTTLLFGLYLFICLKGLQSEENAEILHISITPFGILLAYAKMQPDATCSQKALLSLQFLHVLIVSVSCQTADLQGEFPQCK